MKKGLYRHFKGGLYVVTDIAVSEATKELMAVYHPFGNRDVVWVRPVAEFDQTVSVLASEDGQTKRVQRFTLSNGN